MTWNAPNNSTPRVVSDLDIAQTELKGLLQGRNAMALAADVLISRTQVLPYSVVRFVRFKCAHDVLDVFLKRVVPGDGNVALARSRLMTEAEVLRDLGERMPGQAAPLFAVFPDQLVLATAACNGQQMDAVVCRGGISQLSPAVRARFENISEACGRWLRRFHELTREPAIDLRAWLRYERGEVSWRVALLERLDPANALLYRESGEKLRSELADCSLPLNGCRLHGDFAPHNIFVEGTTGIQVLDFYASRPGHPLHDLVNFIGKICGLAESPTFSAENSRRACVALLKGYGPIRSEERTIARQLIVLQAIKRLLVIVDARRGGGLRARLNTKKGWYESFLARYVSPDEGGTSSFTPWPFLDLEIGK